MVNVAGALLLLCLVAAVLYGLGVPARLSRRAPMPPGSFPDAWRDFLRNHVDFYAELGDEARARFEASVARFIAEQTITGPRGAAVTDETKLLVAASAVILVFGIPGFSYPLLRDIVVYPTAFDDDYRIDDDAHVAGMVHAQGPILFSERDLRLGFKKEHDGYNVGLHEFAHVLDFEGGAHADGVPAILPWKNLRAWSRVLAHETVKIEKHASVLRAYGAKNDAEFFAVATEFFFERPHALKEKHPELYASMVEIFRQDPATRGDSAS